MRRSLRLPCVFLLSATLAFPALPAAAANAQAPAQPSAAHPAKPPTPASPLAKARRQAEAAQSAAAAARNAADAAAARADQARMAYQAAALAAENARAANSSGSTTRMLADTQAAQDVARARENVMEAQQALDAAVRQAQIATIPLPGNNSPPAQQQAGLLDQARVTAAQMRLSMAQQQLASAQSRAADAAVQSGLDSNRAVNETATATATDAMRAARLRYDRLTQAARIAEAKARAYEQAAVEAWQEVERLRKAVEEGKSGSK